MIHTRFLGSHFMGSRFIGFSLPAVLAALAIGCGGPAQEGSAPSATAGDAASKFVAVTQFVEHPALDAVRDGIADELAAAGYEPPNTLKWERESAQGDVAIAAQIATKFVSEQPDVIVAIATPSAQAVASANDNIPVIFSAVTDPVGAKLVSNLDQPEGLITGVSDLAPITQQMDLIAEILPEAQRLGVIYNAGEANSISLVNLLKQEAPARNMEIVEATTPSSAEVATAARSLVGKVDAIYFPTDNTVASAAESVIQVGLDNQLPVFSGDTDSVERGAIATLGFNYYDVGRQTGQMVLRVFDGEQPGDISVEFAKKLSIFINPSAAEAMGVTLPADLVARADEVVE